MNVRPLVAVGACAVLTACGSAASTTTTPTSPPGLDKIDHVVVLMQENRSYDAYFAQLHSQGQPASPADGIPGGQVLDGGLTP